MKSINKVTPAYIFLNSVKRKLIDDIPFENSFDFYKKKAVIPQQTTFTEFLEACSVVFLSQMIQTKEMIGTHNSVNTYVKVMMERNEIKYQRIKKEVTNARETNS